MRKFLTIATAALLLLACAAVLASWANSRRAVSLLAEFRPIGGVRNNVLHPEMNAVPGSAELALAPLRFAGNNGEPMDGPNARLISNIIAGGTGGNGEDSETTDPVASAWLYVFGQFVDHDLSLERSEPDGPPIDIVVPPGDPVFQDGTVIGMTRDIKSPLTHTVINTAAGYLDLSQLYGSSEEVAAKMRDADGSLKTSYNGQALQIIDGRFFAGDPRVGENPEISAVTMLFMREHNYWAGELRTQHARWSADQIYQMARAITTAEYQNIIYTEYLPVLIGPVLGRYRGYNPTIAAQVSQEFSAAAFRVGHSQVSETQSGIDNQGRLTYTQSLAQAFFNTPEETLENGVNDLMRNVTNEYSQATDVYTVGVLRNLLFAPLPGGTVDQADLIAIDIQRGRDAGLGTLNQTRKALGLAPYSSIAQVTDDPLLQTYFDGLYGGIDQVDLFMGGQAERHVGGGAVGETFQAIIKKQFAALRDGDRFFWNNQGFDHDTAQAIARTRLSDLLRRNTDTLRVPDRVFLGPVGAAQRRKPKAPAGPIDNHGRPLHHALGKHCLLEKCHE